MRRFESEQSISMRTVHASADADIGCLFAILPAEIMMILNDRFPVTMNKLRVS
jgi:hypothetical protein